MQERTTREKIEHGIKMCIRDRRLAIIIPVVRPTAKTKTKYADVAELADALDSGSSSLKRVWAVSYTHLDVYKRQVQIHCRV